MRVFADTSAMFALIALDQRHDEAIAALAALVEQRARLVTHNYVVVETNALVTNRIGMAGTTRLHREILPAIDVEWVSRALHDRAIADVLAAGRAVSLVDRVNFGFMRELALRTAFGFDDDFKRAGFTTVP